MRTSFSIYKLIIAVFLFISSIQVHAVPATPYPVTKVQPDGSELTIYLRGDEFFKYELTTDGYLIKRNPQGFYHHAIKDKAGNISITDIRVNPIEKRTRQEHDFLKNKNPFPDFSRVRQERKMQKIPAASQSISSFPKTGSPQSIVILVNFKDVKFSISEPQIAFTNLLNEVGYKKNGGTGSARDYFITASNGVSSPDFIVVGPYTLPDSMAYYGSNDKKGDDKNPRRMVIDACVLAASDGINFSQFDTDGDGIVDNVFIYYAGHNEAEGGPEDSVWPHRWELEKRLIIDGVQIKGYACSSELRGSRGAIMCGIGTFAHEFGHVYGLVDYYATEGGEHHTLSKWSIMDEGAYLNEGRTPPTYSAYDRFYLGWLTPTILKSSRSVSLPDLKSSNKAYLISPTKLHNLEGNNPNPKEFFLLENRQKTGWDAFLPNSGMLITRINYNAFTWSINSPNNDKKAMGVDIMEADGIADKNTLAGDPFPGFAMVTHFNPTLRDGTNIEQPITNIRQSLIDDLITFDFMGGGLPPVINTNHHLLTPFFTAAGIPSEPQEFTVSGQRLKSNIIINFKFNENFELQKKNDPTDTWTKSIELIATDSVVENTVVLIRYNPVYASLDDTHFEYLNIQSDEADLEQKVISGMSTPPPINAPTINEEQITSSSIDGFTASWNAVQGATGYYLTVYNVKEGTSTLTEAFDNGLTAPVGWIIKASSLEDNDKYAGASSPAIQFTQIGDFIQTEKYLFPPIGFSFYVRSIGATSGTIVVEARRDNRDWKRLGRIAVFSDLNATIEFLFTESKDHNLMDYDDYNQFRISFEKTVGYVNIDDVSVKFDQQIEFNFRNHWTTETSTFVDMLIPDREYYYFVKASNKVYNPNKTIRYEDITSASPLVKVLLNQEEITQFTNKDKNKEAWSVFVDTHKNIILNKGEHTENNQSVYIYSLEGILLRHIESDNQMVLIQDLKPGEIYLIKAGSKTIKIIL